MQKSHITAHTGLRGVAAALVALLHMHYQDLIPNHLWEPVMSVAVSWYPVDVFFMLSGFILGYVYISDIRNPKFEYKNYIAKRFARVAPLHYLTVFVAGIMALVASYFGFANRGYYLGDVLPQILMVHAYPFIGNGGWNGPSWSISMEFFAYLFLFPVIIRIVAKGNNSYLFLLLCFFFLATIWAVNEHATRGWPAIMRISCHFSIGYILYALTNFKNPVCLFATRFVSFWLFLAVIWMFFHDAFSDVISRYLFQVIFALLILGSADNGDSLAKKILSNKIFVWLGIISYSIYMIHNLIGKVIHVFLSKVPDNLTIRMAVVVVSYSFLLFMSWLTFKFFEVPARNLVNRALIKK